MRRLRVAAGCAVAAVVVAGLGLAARTGATTDSPAATTSLTTVGSTAAMTHQTNGVVWSLAYANGVMYAGGTFTSVRPAGAAPGTGEVKRTNFAAFDATTGALLHCSPKFTESSGTATVRAMRASTDGNTLYVGGYFNSAGGVKVTNMAAIDTTKCAVKTLFHPQVSATVRAIAFNRGTPIYIGGEFKSVNGKPRSLIASLASTGALHSWNPDAVANSGNPAYTSVRAITVSAGDTRVALGGDFDLVGGKTAHRIAVVSATTGAVTNTFPGLIDKTSAVKALTHDQKNFYLGAEGTGGGVFDGRAAINFATGAVVWKDTCLGANQALLMKSGVLYSASHAHDCHNTPGGFPDGARHHLLAQDASDMTILPWFPNTDDGSGPGIEGIGPRALAMSPDGTLWVGGEFQTVNGKAQQGLTRFPPKPDNNVPAAPVPDLASNKAGQVMVRWRTTWDTDQGSLTYKLYRGSTLIDTQTADSRFSDRPQLSYVDTGLTPGSLPVYHMTVSDGTNTSPAGGTAGIRVASADTAYPNSVLADSPSLYWQLDENSGGFAADSSTNNNSGVMRAVSAYGIPGPVAGSTAVTLDGATGTVQSNNKVTAPSTFSLDMWFKTVTGKGALLIGFGNGSITNSGSGLSSQYDRNVYMTNSGQLVFGEYNGGYKTAMSSGKYNDGKWHNVVATAGPAGMHLYVDGSQVASNSNTGASTYSGYWHVGRDTLNGWPNRPSSGTFNGSIDEVSVYNAQLTAAQVATAFKDSAAAR